MIDIMGSRYRNIPKEVVVPIVKAKGYQRLDALILTHDDFDHSGGKEELLKELNVTRIIDHKDKAEPIKGLPLVSAGRNNRYHHPSTAIMQRLRQENIPALVSARDGAVSIRFCRYFSYYVSAEGAIGILHGLWE